MNRLLPSGWNDPIPAECREILEHRAEQRRLGPLRSWTGEKIIGGTQFTKLECGHFVRAKLNSHSIPKFEVYGCRICKQ